MLPWLLTLALAKPPLTEADVIDGEWRAMQVLRVRPDAYRVIREPFTLKQGPITLTLTEGVLVPIFSGFHEKDRDGKQQARAEAFMRDSKAPPPLQEGDVEFVGFAFAGAKGTWELEWQERADHLILANHMVTHVGADREDWVDVAHGAPWGGTLQEGWLLDTRPEVLEAFLGPDAPPEATPYDVVVYGEKDYTAARLRARMLFHDRRELMMRTGFHPGQGIAWDRVADKHGLATRGRHQLVDLHIGGNLGAQTRGPVQQPADIDWLALQQDWTGTLNSRRHTVIRSLDVDVSDRIVSDVITGVPFPPEDPEDPTSPPLPGARLETEEAFILVQAVPITAQLRVEVKARLKLKAVGGDFQIVQLRIPRAGSQHDWRLLEITRDDGTPLISNAPLIEYFPDGGSTPGGPRMLDRADAANKIPSTDPMGEDGEGSNLSVDSDRALATAQVDVTRNRLETRVTLALPGPLRAGESLVVDVSWRDRWPYGDTQFITGGDSIEGPSVVYQGAAASGPMGVLPRPAGSSRDQPTRFQVQVVTPDRTPVTGIAAGATVREWSEAGYRHSLSAQLDQPVPWVDVHVGAFTIHDEPATQGFPAIRTRTFNKGLGAELAAETRAQINFFQGFLPPFPWPEHDVVLGPGGVDQLWWASAHGMTAAGVSGVTSVTQGGNTTRQAGKHTTQMLMAHELAHQWFGQSVRPAHLSDAWVAETFSEVFAALYVQALHGSSEQIYTQKRRNFENLFNRPVTRTSLVGAYEHPDQRQILFDYGPYVFQEMLRPRLGNERYHGAIDLLAREFAGKALTTEQVQAWFEGVAEEDLDDFFDFWIYGGFVPRKVVLHWDWADGQLQGRLETDVPFGRFEVPVVVDGVPHPVEMVDGEGALELPLEAEPEEVLLDPEHRILTLRRTVRRGLHGDDE